MSQHLVNQITIDCLLNRSAMGEHIMKQREKQINKDEVKFYRKRINNLFKELVNNEKPDDLPPDVKYAYDTFIKATINYFKISDNNDLLQEDYNDIVDDCGDNCNLLESDKFFNDEANKMLMRSVKMDSPTLDKYVKRTIIKKEEDIILPKLREVNIMNPKLKNKGLKKNNINNLYEDSAEDNNEE